MAKVLSASSRLRTGLYKTSTTLFFTPSKLFEAQMTEIFDEVWPTVTAIIEFIKAKHADKYFGKRILEEVKGRQTISASPDKKNLQIKSLSCKGAFKAPSDKEAAYRVMKTQNVTT